MLTRRDFMKLGAVGGAGVMVSPRFAGSRTRPVASTGQTPLPGSSIALSPDSLAC